MSSRRAAAILLDAPALSMSASRVRFYHSTVQDEAPDGRRRSQVEVRPTHLGTPEELQRRGDAADELFREMKRRIAAQVRT